VEKKKYLILISIRKCDRLTKAYILIAFAISAPTAISKYLNISCLNFQSHCIMAVTKRHWKRTWTTNHQHTVKHNQVTL